MTGSAFSTNILVPGEGFNTSGNIKTFTKKAENGNSIESHFCPECGSTLWASGAPWGDNKVIKVGGLDSKDALENWKPVFELYAPNKPTWLVNVEGAESKKAMPDSDNVN